MAAGHDPLAELSITDIVVIPASTTTATGRTADRPAIRLFSFSRISA